MKIDELREMVSESLKPYRLEDANNRKSLIRRIASAGKQQIKNQRSKKVIDSIMPSELVKESQRKEIWDKNPLVSIVVPLYKTPERYLVDMIDSVREQTYVNWELCLADGSCDGVLRPIIDKIAAKDERIRYMALDQNYGIAGNTNKAIKCAEGKYIALLDHDDILHPSAIYECVKKLSLEKSQFVYTDEATFEGTKISNVRTSHRKPAYSPERLRCVNYICHFVMFDKALLDRTGMFEEKYDGSQDHAMMLKLTDAANRVSHVGKVLYFWREHKQSVSKDIAAKAYAIDAGIRAVKENEEKNGWELEVESCGICATQYHLKYALKEHPLVEIIAITRSEEELQRLSEAIVQHTSYDNYVISNAYSVNKIKNKIQGSDAEYIICLSQGMEPLTDNWIEEMLGYAQRPDILAVGAKVIDSDGKLLQSGGRRHRKDGNIVDSYRGVPYNEIGYMGELFYAHNVEGLEYTAMLCRKETFMSTAVGNEGAGVESEFAIPQKDKGRMLFQPYAVFVKR